MPQQGLEKLYSREEIARQVQRLGAEISRDYAGRELVLVCVLKGAFLFFADLVRSLSLPVAVDFVRVASYGPHLQTTGVVEVRKDLEMSIADRHVLIVDDILDSGYTLEALCQQLAGRRPASLKTCVLLDKRQARQTDFEADYAGIRFDSGFVVGYGLDYQENYRDLADIYLFDPARSVKGGVAMVIQCPHCQAPFKLPQDKVKQGGTKVRCTKCKIIFMVTPPQSGGAASATTADKSFEAERDPGFADDFAEGFETSDFFSDGDEGDEFLLGQEPVADEDPFFTEEDPELDQQEVLTWTDEEADPFGFADTDQEEERAASTESLPPFLEEPVAEEDATGKVSDEVVLTLAVEDEPKNDDTLADLTDEESYFGQGASRMPLPAPRPLEERRKRFPLGGLWFLMFLVLLAGGGYAYYARQQLAASWQQLLVDWQLIPVPPQEGRALKPVKLTGYFVSNRREGKLFVIQGQVLNEGAEARAAIVVRGTVYDRAGGALVQQSAFCGNPMGREQLRSWSMLRMAERMQNQFGEMLANLNLAPQKSIPFTLVFKDLPGEVAEFEVTVLASDPVIK